VNLFQQGLSCARAVLSVFAPDFELQLDAARRISQRFGAGIGRKGNMCGSLAGAIMVIGLRYGGTRGDDSASKEQAYAAVAEFIEEFKMLHSSMPALTC
jgi:C_GCAxxG_C_C family probable redox protein